MAVRDGEVWERGRRQCVQGESEEVGKGDGGGGGDRGGEGGGGCVSEVGFEPGGEGKGAKGEGGVGEQEECVRGRGREDQWW